MTQRQTTSGCANRPESLLRLRSRLGLTVLLLTTCLSPLSAQNGLLQLDDLRLETNLSDPLLSPDGNFAVVVASKPNYEDNRFDRSLVLVDLGDGARLDLTPHRPKVRLPRWSPDGRTIAFIDSGPDDEKPQLYLLPIRGGEARQLSQAAGGVETYAWSADGSHIYFAGVIPPEEVEGEERHNKSFEVGYNSFLTKEAPRTSHLWRISIEDGDIEQMTEGEENVRSIAVSPDGERIAYELTPDADTGSAIRTRVRLHDLTDDTTIDLDGPQPTFLAEFSPDGSDLAVAGPVGVEPYFNPMGLFLADADSGDLRYASANVDRQIMDTGWLPDGETLLIGGIDLSVSTYWLLAGDGSPERLDLAGVHPRAPAISDAGIVVFVGQENERPAEIYSMKVGEWRPKRLTDFNAELEAKTTGAVETVSWSGPDGFDQNGILIYPPGYEEGRKYPLVLVIHGGPMGASIEAFSLTRQLMAAQGWLVFSPNYRGSSTQGKAFQTAVINDAGEGPGRDVMSGVEVLKERGIVDESRIAVSGWSYGGYMTVWLTAHYDGWRVAMAGAAVTDWFDWYNMADMNTWAGFGLGGSPWLNDNAMNYWRQSPIAYAHQIRTPTLILSNTGDERVTVSQSYKLYHALQDNGTEVQFVAYPIPGHFPGDPVHERDLWRRWIGWIADHFEVEQ